MSVLPSPGVPQRITEGSGLTSPATPEPPIDEFRVAAGPRLALKQATEACTAVLGLPIECNVALAKALGRKFDRHWPIVDTQAESIMARNMTDEDLLDKCIGYNVPRVSFLTLPAASAAGVGPW